MHGAPRAPGSKPGPRAGEPRPPGRQVTRGRVATRAHFVRGVRPQRFCKQVTLGQPGPGPRRAAKFLVGARFRVRDLTRQDDRYTEPRPAPPPRIDAPLNEPPALRVPSVRLVRDVREQGGSHTARVGSRWGRYLCRGLAGSRGVAGRGPAPSVSDQGPRASQKPKRHTAHP